jgi:hypothetical protein
MNPGAPLKSWLGFESDAQSDGIFGAKKGKKFKLYSWITNKRVQSITDGHSRVELKSEAGTEKGVGTIGLGQIRGEGGVRAG